MNEASATMMSQISDTVCTAHTRPASPPDLSNLIPKRNCFLSADPIPRSRYVSAVGFCVMLALSLPFGSVQAQGASTSSGSALPDPSATNAPYPAGFDPLYDLPTPAAFSGKGAQVPIAKRLREDVNTDGSVLVRVDLRLPMVATDRLDALQRETWLSDLEQATEDLLAELPTGTYSDVQRATDSASINLRVDAAGLEQLLASPSVASIAAAGDAEMRRIAAGPHYSLGIKADGSLWAWGTNSAGNLGDGTTTNRTTPVKVLTGVTAVTTGTLHSLALKTDGSLWDWGWNLRCQLGDGTAKNRLIPFNVLTGVKAMAAGHSHSLALKTDGTLWGWGDNSSGQIGDGTTTMRKTPYKILTGVVAVAAGDFHSLALKTDGSLWAWGENGYAQLGDGTTTKRLTPVKVLTGVAAIDAGGIHTLALKTDGSLWVWGAGGSGQIGNGSNLTRLSPVNVLTGVSAVAAGSVQSFALKTDGKYFHSIAISH
jgi:hypothetical protein